MFRMFNEPMRQYAVYIKSSQMERGRQERAMVNQQQQQKSSSCIYSAHQTFTRSNTENINGNMLKSDSKLI